MFKAITIRFLYLILGGSLTLLFLMIAQVSMDDLRFKEGGLRRVSDPLIQVGGFYTVRSDGQVHGPLCVLHPKLLGKYYRQSTSSVKISNMLGASLPVLSRWTKGLFSWVGVDSVLPAGNAGGEQTTVNWQGHTLSLGAVLHQRIASDSSLSRIISESYSLDPDCEPTVVEAVRDGQCVAVVFRVTSVSGQKFGYHLAGRGRCILAGDATEPMFHPTQPRKFGNFLTRVKDWLGLIDYVVVDA